MTTVSGYPVVCNSISCDLGGFTEEISPSAIDRTVNGGADVMALFAHDATKPLGRRSAGSLDIQKDAHGLLINLRR